MLSHGRLLIEGSSGAGAASCQMYAMLPGTGELIRSGGYYCDEFGPDGYLGDTHSYVSGDKYYDLLQKWQAESLFDEIAWVELILDKPEPVFARCTGIVVYYEGDGAYYYLQLTEPYLYDDFMHNQVLLMGTEDGELFEYVGRLVTAEGEAYTDYHQLLCIRGAIITPCEH